MGCPRADPQGRPTRGRLSHPRPAERTSSGPRRAARSRRRGVSGASTSRARLVCVPPQPAPCASARRSPPSSAPSGGWGASEVGLRLPPGGAGRGPRPAPGPSGLWRVTPADAGLDLSWLRGEGRPRAPEGRSRSHPGARRGEQAPPGERQVRPAHGQRLQTPRMTNRL